MKIKRMNHEEHEGSATKKSMVRLPFFRTAVSSEKASLREALFRVLRVLRGSIFRSASCGVTA
jgi:hypothetical protein